MKNGLSRCYVANRSITLLLFYLSARLAATILNATLKLLKSLLCKLYGDHEMGDRYEIKISQMAR
jgi:hypothetical protein